MANKQITTVGFRTRDIDNDVKRAMKKDKGISLSHEWLWSMSGVGDDQAGIAYGVDTFDGEDVGGNKFYYIVTDIKIASVTADMVSYLTINSDEFTKWRFPGVSDKVIYLWKAGTHTLAPDQRDILKEPIHLGRPAIGNTGAFTFTFSTNTDAEQYDVVMKGIALSEPPPNEFDRYF